MKFDIYQREREKNYNISLLSFLFVPPLACRNTDNTQQNPNNHISTTDTDNSVKNIIINDKSYSITLEDNDTVNDLINLLPLDITMDDLNNNEKYYYFILKYISI